MVVMSLGEALCPHCPAPWRGHIAVFPQLKNKFLEMNSVISWNLSQFPEIEEGHSVRVRCPRKFTICTT